AVKAGMTNSTVASAPFTITQQAAMPTISPNGGTFTSAQSVSLASGTSGAAIHYTTNGSAPTTSSTLYNNTPFTVSSTATVKAIAVKAGMTNSTVASAPFTINLDTQAPTVPAINAPTAVTTTSFNISWVASTDIRGVAGYRYSINGSTWQTTTTTNASFSGLTAGAYIPFQVKAYDAANNESSLANREVRLSVVPPGALDLRSRSSTTGDIYWVASTSANLAGYEYRLNAGIWIAASSSPVFLTGLTASTTYAVDVRAKNTMGDYSTLSSGSLTTIMFTLPPPTNPVRTIANSCQWRATWDAVAGAQKYEVQDTNSYWQTVYTNEAYVDYCSYGNSSGNMPSRVRACTNTFCGNPANFTN
ncbi:MAG TPA: chitobiase/beta-hexosaminidase C-terminal domain-containing protein, partial [Cellvibrio sp.]|nr:chitobiase/beta-hexosaminidase C-terminal domain-containing protein [Cellvibrio sp.]